MKKLKKILAGLFIGSLAVSLAGCFPKEEGSSNKDVISSQENKIEVVKDGKFVENRDYNVNGQCTISEDKELGITATTIEYSAVYKFNKNGTLTIKDLKDNSEKSFTYEIISNIIKVESSSEEFYLDYYEDIVIVPVRYFDITFAYFTGILDGVVASERGTSTLGYHFEIEVDKDDLPSVFNGEKSKTSSHPASKGLVYKIYKNGKVYSNSKGIAYVVAGLNSDQVIGFDSSTTGYYIIDVVYSKISYKAVLHVK